jgi:ubiquinone/menaquinone biosynthesis C-methylase UbiE
MGVYERYILPRIINCTMQNRMVAEERSKLVPLAAGTVLEIGIGSALNVPLYAGGVARLVGIDPSRELWKLGGGRAKAARFPVRFVRSSAEQLPFRDRAFDTAVMTWTLCSIPNPVAALREAARALKPGGRLLFIEHGRSPSVRVSTWQDRLTPIWRRIGGGCHLNRDIDAVIREAGFELDSLQTGYLKGPRPLTYLYRGVAHATPLIAAGRVHRYRRVWCRDRIGSP